MLNKIILTSLLGQSPSTIKKPISLAQFVVLEPATLNSILIVLLVTKAHYYMTQHLHEVITVDLLEYQILRSVSEPLLLSRPHPTFSHYTTWCYAQYSQKDERAKLPYLRSTNLQKKTKQHPLPAPAL